MQTEKDKHINYLLTKIEATEVKLENALRELAMADLKIETLERELKHYQNDRKRMEKYRKQLKEQFNVEPPRLKDTQ